VRAGPIIAAALAGAFLAPAPAGAATAPSAPQAVSASYNIFLHGAHVGTMNESFEANEGGYQLVSESHAAGVLALFQKQPVRFVSAGRLTAAGLQPQRFEGKRSDNDPRRVRGEFAARRTGCHSSTSSCSWRRTRSSRWKFP
jgi:hypothetical protein